MSGSIIVPVDGSELSLRALDLAIDLSRVIDASVKIVHVVEISKAAVVSYGDPQYVSSLLRALRDDGESFLKEAAERAAGKAPLADTELLEGNPAREIVRCAAQSDARWIVMGSHGRSGLSHLMAGSVAEGVLRHSTVPVLVVPMKYDLDHTMKGTSKHASYSHLRFGHSD